MGNSHQTLVANRYHEDIQARVTVNEVLLDRLMLKRSGKFTAGVEGEKIGVRASNTTESEYKHVRQLPGFVIIRSGSHLAFEMSGRDGRVWVTITCGEQVIADNFPVANGYSVIVDDRGYVQRATLEEVLGIGR